MSASRVREWLAFTGFVAALLAGACWLPYRFPPSVFVTGASFEVGFNNAVAYLAYLVLLAGPSWMVFRWLPAAAGPGPREGRPAVPAASWAVFGAAALAHAALFAALYLYKGRFVFAESLYFQTLLHRMTLGEVPYVDFSFYYGPAMLYPAYWLTRVFSVEAAYACWFIATYLLGLFMLWRLLAALLPSPRLASGWFVLLALALFNPWAGLNVTFVRYLLPSAVFLVSAPWLRDGGWTRGAAAAALLAAAMAYSFEVAVLSAAGVAAAALLHDAGGWPGKLRAAGRAAGLAAVSLAAAAGVFYLLDPSGQAWRLYPEIARSYAGGAHNLPVYPNVPLLALTGMSVLVIGSACRWLASAWRAPSAPWVAAYLLLALATLRGAFGVAEPSHFAYFSLPMALLGVLVSVLVPWGRWLRRALAAVVVLGFALPMQYYHGSLFAPFLAARRGGVQEPPASSGQPLQDGLAEMVRRAGVERPYLMYGFDYESFPVYRRLGLRYPSYYTMLINARTEEGMRRVIEDLRRTRAIVLVRSEPAGEPAVMPRAGITRVLDALSGAHTMGSRLQETLRRSEARLEAPLREFLRREYQTLYESQGITALEPRGVQRRAEAW